MCLKDEILKSTGECKSYIYPGKQKYSVHPLHGTGGWGYMLSEKEELRATEWGSVSVNKERELYCWWVGLWASNLAKSSRVCSVLCVKDRGSVGKSKTTTDIDTLNCPSSTDRKGLYGVCSLFHVAGWKDQGVEILRSGRGKDFPLPLNKCDCLRLRHCFRLSSFHWLSAGIQTNNKHIGRALLCVAISYDLLWVLNLALYLCKFL